MAVALSLLSLATNGTSFEELRKGLNLNNDKAIIANQFHDYFRLIQKNAGDSKLTIANRIYVPKEFQLNKDFQDIASEKFFSGIESVDFKNANNAAQTINNFVKEKTEEKITEIVKPEEFDGQTGVILINTITFKSFWKYPFSAENTERDIFRNNKPIGWP